MLKDEYGTASNIKSMLLKLLIACRSPAVSVGTTVTTRCAEGGCKGCYSDVNADVAWIFLITFSLIRFQADYLVVVVAVRISRSIANIVGFYQVPHRQEQVDTLIFNAQVLFRCPRLSLWVLSHPNILNMVPQYNMVGSWHLYIDKMMSGIIEERKQSERYLESRKDVMISRRLSFDFSEKSDSSSKCYCVVTGEWPRNN
ncbi:unnamed protein product [Amaranthus hypochondriacus]